jgi:hypothetical protein
MASTRTQYPQLQVGVLLLGSGCTCSWLAWRPAHAFECLGSSSNHLHEENSTCNSWSARTFHRSSDASRHLYFIKARESRSKFRKDIQGKVSRVTSFNQFRGSSLAHSPAGC